MTSRQTYPYGNPAHHTGQGVPLGAPGTTGALETYDPLGAPGTTGASPTTTGYGAAAGTGGQEQLHRPATDQGYAYGTAASMGHAGHARVAVPVVTTTTGVTAGYDTGAYGTGGGYDTGSFPGIGHTVGSGQQKEHEGHYDTGGDKDRSGSYDTGSSPDIGHTTSTGQHGGDKDRAHGLGGQTGGYDTGSFPDIGHTTGTGQQRGHEGRYDTGGDKDREHGLGGQTGGYDTGGGQTHEQKGSYDTGGGQTYGQRQGGGYGGGYEAGADWARTQGGRDSKSHGQEVKEQGSGYDTGGVKGRGGSRDADDEIVGVCVTEVEVVSDEPLPEEQSKGIIDRILDHIPGGGGGAGAGAATK